MPIYEFACTTCGHEFEELVRSSAARRPLCPQCGARKVERKLSVFASSTKASSGAEAPPSCNVSGGASCGRCCAGVPHRH
ncbi:MAG: zinc ribbon domain-containing protein [Verrucomicrobiae bacterium]|nr:zinc ribbon domain-containing protein [Verrucomicrobiae bacterium]